MTYPSKALFNPAVVCWGFLLTMLYGSQAIGGWNDAVTASNPLNWYRLDEITGETAIDYGSEGRHGTYGVDSPVRGQSGLVGGAIEFLGEAEYVLLGGPALPADWTAEFVLKRTGERFSSILMRNEAWVPPHTALKLEQFPNTHEFGFTRFGSADHRFTPAVTAPLNEFVHAVYVKSSSGTSIYLDGSRQGSSASVIDLSRYQLGAPQAAEAPFAVLDEVVLYDRALSPAEIRNHFEAIPEPSTFALAALALLGLLVWGWRCRKVA